MNDARKRLRSLLRPQQRALHFKHESDRSRKVILAALRELAVSATGYRAPQGMRELEARELALRSLVRGAVATRTELLVIDQDDSVLKHDRRWLRDELHQSGLVSPMRFCHLKRHEEILLALPDAIAWCLQRGGFWTSRVQPMITKVVTLD